VETLKAVNLIKTYKKRRVVNKVSVEIAKGEIVGLLGPNGAGKTTTFYMVVGLAKPERGRIFLGDKDITRLPMYRRALMGISYLPQEASIFRKLTVEDNVTAVLENRELTRLEIKKKVRLLLRELGVFHLKDTLAYSLSGGERRRVEIARALATSPSFILLDEPFAGIDPIAVGDIQDIIARLKDKEIGVLITDHNVRETLSITDRAYLVADGKVLISGSAQDLINDPQAKKIYLGEKFKM